MPRTITAANAAYSISVPNVIPALQTLQGFAVDAAFMTDAVDFSEVQMGVDGQMGVGFTPKPTPQTISLLASSLSVDLFEAWAAANRAALTSYPAYATILLPSVGKVYTCTEGYLGNQSATPEARRVLQTRTFTITWRLVVAAPIPTT